MSVYQKIMLEMLCVVSVFSVAPMLAMRGVGDEEAKERGDVEIVVVLTPAEQKSLNDRFLQAARDCDASLVKSLIEQKAQVNYVGEFSCTALRSVAGNRCAKRESNAQKIASMLIGARADVNVTSAYRFAHDTPLIGAVKAYADGGGGDKAQMIALLLRAGAAIDLMDLAGNTALCKAFECSSVEIAARLLAAGACPEVGSALQDRSMCWAFASRCPGGLEALIWARRKPDVPRSWGLSFWEKFCFDRKIQERMRQALRDRCEAYRTRGLINKKLEGVVGLAKKIDEFLGSHEVVGWWRMALWDAEFPRDILRVGVKSSRDVEV